MNFWKKKRHKSLDSWRLYVPDWSRTSGLLLRRQSLYPTELQELIYIITVLCNRYNQIIQFWTWTGCHLGGACLSVKLRGPIHFFKYQDSGTSQAILLYLLTLLLSIHSSNPFFRSFIRILSPDRKISIEKRFSQRRLSDRRPLFHKAAGTCHYITITFWKFPVLFARRQADPKRNRMIPGYHYNRNRSSRKPGSPIL